MNAKSIAIGVVAMVVATVLVVTCAVPIISDSVATEDTYKNEGYFRMAKYTSSDTFVASWDYENPNQITINGVVEKLPTSMNVLGVSIILGDNYYLRYVPRDSAVTLYYDGVGNMTASPETSTGMTIELGSEYITFQLTGSASTTRQVATLTDFYAVNSTGPYVMKDAEKPAYLNGDSSIYGCGRTSLTNNIVGTLVTGTIDDGVTVDIWRGVEGTTASNIEVHSTEVSSHIDLYSFESVTFNADYTYEDTDYSPDLTYSYVVVPYQITAERSVHVDGPTGDILAVIPILMVLGIVIGAVALFLTTRRD